MGHDSTDVRSNSAEPYRRKESKVNEQGMSSPGALIYEEMPGGILD